MFAYIIIYREAIGQIFLQNQLQVLHFAKIIIGQLYSSHTGVAVKS